MKKACHITFLIGERDKPSTKYRIIQYLPYFQRAGIKTNVIVMKRGIKRYFLLKTLGPQIPCIFVQKKLPSLLELNFIRKKCKILIYDVDDAVIFKKDGQLDLKKKERFHRMINAADIVIVGNVYLKTLAGEKAIVIPTPVDTDFYRKIPVKKETINIGWIGTSSTLPYTTPIFKTIRTLAEKYNNIKFHIIADQIQELFSIKELVFREWEKEKEVLYLSELDISIAPLPENNWTLGKCGFKILQYMAMGIPVVASPVGVQKEMVEDGKTGFLAREEEWVTKIEKLIKDESLRVKMGRYAREKVEKEYSLHMWGPKLVGIVQNVLTGKI